MSPLTLSLKTAVAQPVEASRLSPTGLAGLGVAEIERLPLRVGNRTLALAELFDVAAGDADCLVLSGDLARFDRLGRAMTGGWLVVEGDAGAYLGQEIAQGTIEVRGGAGPYAATGATGGLVRVAGDVGDLAGAALAGGRFGMKGGALLVGGKLGDRAGDRMRRGVIAAAGDAGMFLGSRMIAGTIVVGGACGPDPGYAMRRGTLILAAEPFVSLATFADAGRHDLPWLRLLGRHLDNLGHAGPLPGTRARRLTGCLSAGGKGEILIAA